MDKEQLYKRIKAMIISSTKEPKYMAISPVKVADLLGVTQDEIEIGLQDLITEGRLKKQKREQSPHIDIYLLPEDFQAESIVH